MVRQYPHQAVPQVQSTLAKLSLCRTAALGGHKLTCSSCHETTIVYNSCGDRHCPTCSGARRSNWLESTRELIFEGVDHFQVVFTLPDKLSALALGNRREIYDLLFAASWQALDATIRKEHRYKAAAVMVLHTWNQKLDAHAHVHAVVPGCGPSLDDRRLVFAKRDDDEDSIGRYLVDAADLRTSFRDAFLKRLTRLYQTGKLKLGGPFEPLQDPEAWESFVAELGQANWVSFIEPPPRKGQSATHVLKYLTRYLSGGPIADSRIVSTDNQSVTFLARAGDVSGGNKKQVPVRMSQLEFTRRWCLHILPKGYTRTRRFGGWSNTKREQYLETFARLLDSSNVPLPEAATDFDPSLWQSAKSPSEQQALCPSCGAALIPHSESPRPSWGDVMSSPYRPHWY